MSSGIGWAHVDADPGPQSASPTRPTASRVCFRDMRAMICCAWGPVDDLKLEAPTPTGPGPARERRQGDGRQLRKFDQWWPASTKRARPSGLETAGVVASCGEGVTRFKPADRVMAVLAYGGFAEQAIADEVKKDIWRYIEEIRERGLQANPDDYR